jgi:YD repeat-containing protein
MPTTHESPAKAGPKQLRTHLQRPALLAGVCLLLFSSVQVGLLAAIGQPAAAATTGQAPGPLSSVAAKFPPAADARNTTGAASPATALSGERLTNPGSGKRTFKQQELVAKRTASSTVTQHQDGRLTKRQYLTPHFFKAGDGSWQKIDSHLVEDKNAADSSNLFGRALGGIESLTDGTPTTYQVASNDWQARFAPSNDSVGLLRLQKGDQQVAFKPVGAHRVAPTIVTNGDQQTVQYKELWTGVDVSYTVTATAVKENISLKSKAATNQVAFTVVGASLRHQQGSYQAPAWHIEGALDNEFVIAPPNLILNHFGFVSDTAKFKQTYQDGKLTVAVDKTYLQSLPARAFPAVIDPGVYRSTFGSRAGGDYLSYKTDGTVCYSNVCNLYAGSLQDSNGAWQTWRGEFHAPYDVLRGKRLDHANLHLTQRTNAGFWTGTSDSKRFSAWRSDCHGYDCVRPGSWSGETSLSTTGDIDVTSLYRSAMAANDWGAWVMLLGEESAALSFKNFDPDNSYVDLTYSDIIPAPAVTSPVANQVFVDPQVSFKLNPVPNPNGAPPLQYSFCVSSGPGCNGTVISSSDSQASQWTVPDGILQDGSTYYVQARSLDPGLGGYGPYGPAIPFRIDARTGHDKTQTIDSLGPVDVDLATGNLTTSAASHDSAALGGSLGVSLDYNSPLRSRPGLVGQYWNNDSFSGPPALTRVDQNIDFTWEAGSPSAGSIPNDNFSARWSGYLVVPKTGDYYFGGNNDDRMTVTVNNVAAYSSAGCWPGACYGTTAVHLTAGQVVPFQATHVELGGNATARLYVKGAPSPRGMVVPQDWLQTGVRPVSQSQGLVGRYYTDNGSHSFSDPANHLFLSRTDPILSLDWGSGSPVPAGPTDNFLVRWSGYLTVPTTGNYQFGSASDDGTRIYIGPSNALVFDKWRDDGNSERYGNSSFLTAGTPVPITVEYFEHGGGADLFLKVQGAVTNQVVPSSWLSPKAQVLPNGWNLGIDPDGELGYDHLKPNPNSAVLTDSSGDTHEYSWTGSGYKPPVNEDGQLVRNSDGSYSFQDTDGRTYLFDAEGKLTSVTTPTDDRKPAALKYDYSGSPAHLTSISDGVDPGRYAAVYYSGDSQCGSPPSGFDAAAPSGMLCAVKTNDGRASYFYYAQGNLARIMRPGNESTDYQYDSLGRMTAIRDATANDAIAAGVRANDATVLSEVTYDALGRVASVKQPAAKAADNHIQQTIDYTNASAEAWQATVLLNDHVASTPVSVLWDQHRIDLLARGASDDLIHKWWDGASWSTWQSLGGCIMNDPSVASWGYGRLDVIVQGCSPDGNNVWRKSFDLNAGGWQD